jgi:plasmid stabilization system protein ParE
MSEPLFVRITALAAQHIRQAETWWRDNRAAAPNAVRIELQRAFPLIASHPNIGSRATNVKLPGVRRIYLRSIKYHLYYHVIAEPNCVEIVALWHKSRGEGPPI